MSRKVSIFLGLPHGRLLFDRTFGPIDFFPVNHTIAYMSEIRFVQSTVYDVVDMLIPQAGVS